MSDELGRPPIDDFGESFMVVRVAVPGRPSFQRRKGEEGISIFVIDPIEPSLIEAEIFEFKAALLELE